MSRLVTKALGHSGRSSGYNGSAGDGRGAGVVERAISVIGWPGNVCLSSRDPEGAVRVYAIALGVDLKRASRDEHIGGLVSLAHRSAGLVAAGSVLCGLLHRTLAGVFRGGVALLGIILRRAGGVDSVIACDDLYVAPLNRHLGTFETLIALRDIDGSAKNDEILIRMHAVIAGDDLVGSVLDGKHALCLERVCLGADGNRSGDER